MRLFLFLGLFSLDAFSAPPACDESDLVPGAVLNTCTSLTINSTVNLTGSSGGTIEITGMTGDVNINANIILNGADGITISGDNIPGVNGGPGAFGGGGISVNLAEAGQGLSPADGSAGINDGPCSSGGGGGAGANSDGTDGATCTSGASIGAKGVSPGFPGPFAGGFGGGAGGEFLTGPGVYGLGGGGGGGGALLIETTGTINISNGVRISARGGRGGNSVNPGGAGGGGGGGTFSFTAASLNNQGIIDVRGGSGGASTGSLPRGGVGGAGGSGVARFDIAGVITDLTGLQDFSTNGGSSTSSRSNLSSSISCGTISKHTDHKNSFFMMVLGFAFVTLLSSLRRTSRSLSRERA